MAQSQWHLSISCEQWHNNILPLSKRKSSRVPYTSNFLKINLVCTKYYQYLYLLINLYYKNNSTVNITDIYYVPQLGIKMVRIFSDRIWDRIRLDGLKSICIRVRMFNIWYRIRIRILKSYIYDVDIQSYLIQHCWYYLYSNPNPTKNIKINMISVISVRIRSVFIPSHSYK